jgi:hypothetical protein
MRLTLTALLCFCAACDSPVTGNPDGGLPFTDLGNPVGEPVLSFGPAISVPGNGTAAWLATADFNGDGHLDFARAGANGMVDILLGIGDGTFGGGDSYPAADVKQIETGDINGDGKLDLVMISPSFMQLGTMFGKGNGTFAMPASLSTAKTPEALALDDLNGDGASDAVVATSGPGPSALRLFLTGGGMPVDYPLAFIPTTVAIGNFDNAGGKDVVVGGYSNTMHFVTVFLGDTTGKLTAGKTFDVGKFQPQMIKVADVDADGKPDLVLGGLGSATVPQVFVARGAGDGTFSPLAGAQLGGGPDTIVVADLNGGGHLDVASVDTPGAGPSFLTVVLGNGTGLFGPPIRFDNYLVNNLGPGKVFGADVDGDGKTDLIFCSEPVSVVLNTSH